MYTACGAVYHNLRHIIIDVRMPCTPFMYLQVDIYGFGRLQRVRASGGGGVALVLASLVATKLCIWNRHRRTWSALHEST